MEKKIEVEVDGKVIRIMPHMLADSQRFGASELKRQTRKTPDELLNIPAKKILLPELKPAPDLKVSEMAKDAETTDVKTDPLAGVKMENTPAPKAAAKKTVKRNTKKK